MRRRRQERAAARERPYTPEDVRACGPWALVRSDPPVTQSAAGVLYPATAPLEGRKYAVGTVLSTGDGWSGGRPVHRLREELPKGTRVLFSAIVEEVDTSKGHQYLLGTRVYFVRATDIMLRWRPGSVDERELALERW